MTHPYTYETLANDKVARAKAEGMCNQRIGRRRPARPGPVAALFDALKRRIGPLSPEDEARGSRGRKVREWESA